MYFIIDTGPLKHWFDKKSRDTVALSIEKVRGEKANITKTRISRRFCHVIASFTHFQIDLNFDSAIFL